MRTRTCIAAIALGSVAALVGASAAGTSSAPTFTWATRAVDDASSFTEPSVSIDATGNIAVCVPGGPGGTVVWASRDDGATFDRSATDGGGGGDCEIEFLPDGTLVNSDLAITTSYISISKDGGRTWTRGADAGQEQDRQWFAYDKSRSLLYSVYHGIAEEYEFFVRSADGGLTWSNPILINSPDQFAGTPAGVAKPGDTASLVDQGYNTFSGPMAVDPTTGDIYAAYSISNAQSNVAAGHGFGPTRGIVVAHSGGGGELGTWTNKYAVVTNDLSPQGGVVNGAIFPWLTIDRAGTVYVMFNSNEGGAFHTYYTYSTDKTATWSAPIRLDDNADDAGATVYAVGAGGAPGVLDVAWYESENGSGPDDSESLWNIEFAQVRDASSAKPQITRSRVTKDIMHRGQICQMGLLCVTGGDRTLGDFFELAIGPDGMAQIVSSDNGVEGEPKRVVWFKQASGAPAFEVAPGAAPVKPLPRPKPPAAAPRPGPLPTTGLTTVVPLVALGLIGAALIVRRRRRP